MVLKAKFEWQAHVLLHLYQYQKQVLQKHHGLKYGNLHTPQSCQVELSQVEDQQRAQFLDQHLLMNKFLSQIL